MFSCGDATRMAHTLWVQMEIGDSMTECRSECLSRVLRLWGEARLRWGDVKMQSMGVIFQKMISEIEWVIIGDEEDLSKIQRWRDTLASPKMQIRDVFSHLCTDAEMDHMGMTRMPIPEATTDGEDSRSHMSWQMSPANIVQ